MGFWKGLFKRGEDEVLPTYVDDVLGHMDWEDDDESWIGQFQGLTFALSIEEGNAPTREIIEYARSILTDKAWLAETLETCKQAALQSHSYREPEIRALQFVRFVFHDSKRILIQFFKGNDEPYWSAEIAGREFRGIGCDS